MKPSGPWTARVAPWVVVALASAGCAQPGELDALPGTTSPTASGVREDCPSPVAGTWRINGTQVEDRFAFPVGDSRRGNYSSELNQTRRNGTYEIVHQESDPSCDPRLVVFLLFLKEEPGVVTWNFTSVATAMVDNERAWPERPRVFNVTRTADATPLLTQDR